MKKIGILIIFIFFISGSYALISDNILSDNNLTSNHDPAVKNQYFEKNNSNYIEPEIKHINSTNNNIKNINHPDSKNPTDKCSELLRKVNGTQIYVPADIDYTDMYFQDICGRFVALGNTTKKLPEEAICHDACGSTTRGSEITYDEALAMWLDPYVRSGHIPKVSSSSGILDGSSGASSSNTQNLQYGTQNDAIIHESYKPVDTYDDSDSVFQNNTAG